MKSGENENIQRHKEYTLNLMNQIIAETRDASFESFEKDEQLKERVFSQLQEIGEASREIIDVTDEEDLKKTERDTFQRLSLLRNSRYNQVTESSVQQVWSIVKKDLPEMEEELNHDI